ncbi:MAG: HAMP domain-containing sensor histidine kinase [Urechidicola sp.]|nr:HAMP domain-containing sensor histidine kinase [Urechidicola sp.]
MLESKYKNIVYFIAFTIVVTIGVQVYWNIKIYEVNKQQLTNQVQVSFDKAVDNYYNNLAKTNALTFIENDSLFNGDRSVVVKSGFTKNQVWLDKELDSNHTNNQVRVFTDYNIQMSEGDTLVFPTLLDDSNTKHLAVIKQELDSIDIRALSTKIMFSFRESHIDLEVIDSLFNVDLENKNIELNYGFKFGNRNPLTEKITVIDYKLDDFPDEFSSAYSDAAFLPHQSKLQLLYTDTTIEVLKRMLGSIILSLLLSAAIIGCLLFLLKVIFKQKQLSEIKNDLINNITHEFKTPIATISVALEGLQNFDVIKNPDKATNYISMSNEQLSKLNKMVEKLLETATLKTNQFILNKEGADIANILKKCVKKLHFSGLEKTISFHPESDKILANVDLFHFENAINNVLDNAMKYGGDTIKVNLKNSLEITIEDNGNGIPHNQQEKIFNQFYRIPTGNVHNIKGFGIGLYYTKTIIEKHGGSIVVSESKKGKTVFKIQLSKK